MYNFSLKKVPWPIVCVALVASVGGCDNRIEMEPTEGPSITTPGGRTYETRWARYRYPEDTFPTEEQQVYVGGQWRDCDTGGANSCIEVIAAVEFDMAHSGGGH
jgi:hypothetical protein